uniref:3CxxC-type domain-containing protein n=1 Tax=Ciona savignyi TaxID=51511 RepID=H2Y5A6_CIOSA
MEVVWHGEFSRLFSNFYPPHVWYLTITNQAPQQKWKFHRDSAKVRFCCQDCGNGWTSMKGRVTFWFYLNYLTNEGFVQFKLYGQQCKKCNSGKFEYVMWYPEEVSKVMCNVYNKVGQTYYGFLQPPIRIDRRPGRPRNQHNAELCQACRDGECDQARPIKTIFNGILPSPLPNPPLNGAVAPSSTPPEALQNTPPPNVIPYSTPSSDSNASCSNNTPTMTSLVTLSPGLQQPILTYSVVTCPPKQLSANSNHFIPQNGISPPVNFVYSHPGQFTLINGGPPPPMLPPKQYHQPMMKPPADVQPVSPTEVEPAANTLSTETAIIE